MDVLVLGCLFNRQAGQASGGHGAFSLCTLNDTSAIGYKNLQTLIYSHIDHI